MRSSSIPIKEQISAGGVAFRRRGEAVEVALISTSKSGRWQLPKGMVDREESTEAAALREVREETGLDTEMLAPIDKIEYWYYSMDGGRRVRYHEFVYFYLLRYRSGDVSDHDHEVEEARWVEIGQAHAMLAFGGEKKIMARAREMISETDRARARGLGPAS